MVVCRDRPLAAAARGLSHARSTGGDRASEGTGLRTPVPARWLAGLRGTALLPRRGGQLRMRASGLLVPPRARDGWPAAAVRWGTEPVPGDPAARGVPCRGHGARLPPAVLAHPLPQQPCWALRPCLPLGKGSVTTRKRPGSSCPRSQPGARGLGCARSYSST